MKTKGFFFRKDETPSAITEEGETVVSLTLPM